MTNLTGICYDAFLGVIPTRVVGIMDLWSDGYASTARRGILSTKQ